LQTLLLKDNQSVPSPNTSYAYQIEILKAVSTKISYHNFVFVFKYCAVRMCYGILMATSTYWSYSFQIQVPSVLLRHE